MWLNKAQVNKKFFIKIEDDRIFRVEMEINVERYKFTELECEKQFNNYVSEENQMMKSKMKQVILHKINNLIVINNYVFTVWVKGNNYISSKLEGTAFDKPSDQYNYYHINITEFKANNYTFELTVNGIISDLINIGWSLYSI